MPLLLYAGEFGIALIDDQVDQSIAHLLSGYLAQVFPLAAAFEGTELDFVGFDCAVKSIEFKIGDLVMIDADIFSPIVE